MKKFLLPGMVAALAFAACTNEEIISQQTVAVPEADLSQRPVVGMVDLYFGSQTRMAQGVEGFNDLDWTDGDKIGARIIDELSDANKCGYHAFTNYVASPYAWSNYRYDYSAADDMWTSDALMVEGNYMFYAPYDETALYRTALKMEFPLNQTVNGLKAVKFADDAAEDAKVAGNTTAINNFFANTAGQTVVVGHTFVSAEDGGTSVSPEMIHLYAYPVITLVNEYEEPVMVENEDGEMVQAKDKDGNLLFEGKSITIDEITISSSNIYKYYTANHSNLIEALKPELAEVANPKDAKNPLCKGHKAGVLVGNRKTVDFMQNARTGLVATAAPTAKDKNGYTPDGKIVVALDEPVKIPAGEAVKLNVVMPAAEYENSDLLVNVRVLVTDEEGEVKQMKFEEKVFVGDGELADALNYAIMKRFPVEEYNFPAENADPYAKATAGTLATFHLGGDLIDYAEPEKEPVVYDGIKDNAGFYTWLASVTDNSTPKCEGEDFKLAEDHKVEFNAELMAKVNEYLNNAKATVSFTSALNVVGGTDKEPLVIDGAKYPSFGKLTVTSGVVTLNGTSVAELVVKSGATVTTSGATTITKASTIEGNVTLNGATLTAADSKGITFKGTANLNNVTINGDVYFQNGGSVTGKITTTGAATVTNGELVVDAEAAWATVNLYGGNLKITNSKYAPAVNVGRMTGKDGKTEEKGQLTVAAEGLVLPTVTLNTKNSKLVVDEEVEIKALTWTAGTVDNNATIVNAITVPAGATYNQAVENAVVEGDITNNGTINANGVIAVATNNGEIVANAETDEITVAAGTGSINNTVGAVVYDEAETQTVYANMTTAFGNEEIENILAVSDARINKLVVSAKWTVNENYTANALLKIKTIEFKGNGELLYIGQATVDFTGIDVIINGAVTWRGRSTESSVVLNLDARYTKNSTLATSKIDMTGAYASVLANGGTITLSDNLVLDASKKLEVTAGKKVTLNLNGYNLTTAAATDTEILFRVNGELVINGAGSEINTTASGYVASVNTGGKLTVNGGKYTSAVTTFQANGGALYITDGEFNAWDETYNGVYTLNFRDNQGTVIEVSGGKFHNFNPAASNSEPGQDTKSFLAEGATVQGVVDETGYMFKDNSKPHDGYIADKYGDVTYTVTAPVAE